MNSTRRANRCMPEQRSNYSADRRTPSGRLYPGRRAAQLYGTRNRSSVFEVAEGTLSYFSELRIRPGSAGRRRRGVDAALDLMGEVDEGVVLRGREQPRHVAARL